MFVLSPRAAARAATAAASCIRSCWPAIWTPERQATSTRMTAGRAIANSAVVLPASPESQLSRNRQRMPNYIGKDAAHLIGSKYDDK